MDASIYLHPAIALGVTGWINGVFTTIEEFQPKTGRRDDRIQWVTGELLKWIDRTEAVNGQPMKRLAFDDHTKTTPRNGCCRPNTCRAVVNQMVAHVGKGREIFLAPLDPKTAEDAQILADRYEVKTTRRTAPAIQLGIQAGFCDLTLMSAPKALDENAIIVPDKRLFEEWLALQNGQVKQISEGKPLSKDQLKCSVALSGKILACQLDPGHAKRIKASLDVDMALLRGEWQEDRNRTTAAALNQEVKAGMKRLNELEEMMKHETGD